MDDIKQSKQKSQETTKQKPNPTKLMKQIKKYNTFLQCGEPIVSLCIKGQAKEGWGGGRIKVTIAAVLY